MVISAYMCPYKLIYALTWSIKPTHGRCFDFDCFYFSPNWEKIVRFLNETDHDFAYWSIDNYTRSGQETAQYSPNIANLNIKSQNIFTIKSINERVIPRPGQNEGYSLLEMDYETIR